MSDNRFMKIIRRPSTIIRSIGYRGLLNWLDDERYLRIIYRATFGKRLDLQHPVTFNEKLQWLKINDRQPVYTTMVDKYEAKRYVADIIGEEYIIPLLGVWDRFEDIDFDALPDRFVLKCTHDCGSTLICRDKKQFDVRAARKMYTRLLKQNYYVRNREWPYKNVKPRIIAEEYMEDAATGDLRDYKFFTFGGRTELLYVATGRDGGVENLRFDFYDADFHHLDLVSAHPNAPVQPEKPAQFELMKELACRLAKDVPHLRVDFYEANGKVYFG